MPNPKLAEKLPGAYMGMGQTAENVAQKWKISRTAQEEFALRSQARTAAAIAAGNLAGEIVPVVTRDGVVAADGCPRPASTEEGLAALKPAFDVAGSVTAATSSPLTDGASAVLVCSADYAAAHGLPVLARIKATASAGCAPEIMGIGPVAASRKALARAGLEIGAIDVVELNEAFAAQALACAQELGHTRRECEHRWRGHRPWPSAGRHGGAAGGQGGEPSGPHRRPLCAGHAMHRRRAGHRHHSGARLMSEIRKAAVIGAGTMGAAIAAHFCNAGVPVLLLDIVPAGAANRNALADGAIAKMLKTDPAPFMSKAAAKLVTPGNIEDDLAKLAECDWIVEAIIERLDLKQALYRKIETVRRPGCAVSSNTSTIPLSQLVGGMGEAFARDFLITHFFNPPRYMRLLELVTGPDTDPALAAKVADCADRKLGKICCARKGFARLHRQPPGHILAHAGRDRGAGCGADHRGGRRRDGQADGHSQNRRVRADRSGRARPDAAYQCQPRRHAAAGGCVPRRQSRPAAA